jgi:hypothetical protein
MFNIRLEIIFKPFLFADIYAHAEATLAVAVSIFVSLGLAAAGLE